MSRKSFIEVEAENIKELLHATNLTTPELAKELGLQDSSIRSWITRGRIPQEYLIKLIKLCKKSITENIWKRILSSPGLREDIASVIVKLLSTSAIPKHEDEIKGLLKKLNDFAHEDPEPKEINKSNVALKEFQDKELIEELKIRGWKFTININPPY